MTAALPDRMPYFYAVLRAVPRVDRGECVNVGVVLHCQAAGYLGAAVELDTARLLALDPGVDVETVRAALEAVRAVCRGDAAAGRPAAGSRRERFGWLTAPRSTVLQPGPVHSGTTRDPVAELQRLLDRLVR